MVLVAAVGVAMVASMVVEVVVVDVEVPRVEELVTVTIQRSIRFELTRRQPELIRPEPELIRPEPELIRLTFSNIHLPPL